MQAYGAEAGGADIVADADGPRAATVSAGTGVDAVPAGVGNSPLQSYFVDPEFAAVAASRVFGERTADELADGAGCP